MLAGGTVTLEYTISKFRSHRVRSHGSARPHSINAPLRYAEYAKNEVKRNRTLRCSREDCSDERDEDRGRERERERDRERMRQAGYTITLVESITS